VKADFQSRFTDRRRPRQRISRCSYLPRHRNSHTGPAALLRDHRPRLRQINRTAELLGSAHASESGALCAIRPNSGSSRVDSAFSAIDRPDIAYAAVSMLSRFLSQPTYRACMAVMRLLHYLSRTANYGLIYHRDELDMHAYSDSDKATCPVTRRSISGIVVFMCGAPVFWMSRRQQIVATSLFTSREIITKMQCYKLSD
jgi:hypothetical protein